MTTKQIHRHSCRKHATIICRAFNRGLSVEDVAWVFRIQTADVHKIIREAL